jgi:hypothetical protein
MKRATPLILSVAAAVMFLTMCCSEALAQIRIPIPSGRGGQSGAKKLSKGGPNIAATLNPSDFTFDAFVHGGWPLYFDYEIEQPGHVKLTIKVVKAGSFTYDFNKRSAGRYGELITLPSDLASGTAVAAYSIKAVSDDTPGATFIPFTFYALAVGRSVGSSGLTQLLFSPREVRMIGGRPAARASYSFSAIRRFSGGARADIRLMSGGLSKRVGGKSFERAIAPGETVSGAWDCKKGGKPSLGRHKLFVKAWFTLQDSGSWALAQSQESVMISP